MDIKPIQPLTQVTSFEEFKKGIQPFIENLPFYHPHDKPECLVCGMNYQGLLELVESLIAAERAWCLRCLGEEKQYQRKTNSLALHRSDDYVDGSNDRLIIAREKIEGGKEV